MEFANLFSFSCIFFSKYFLSLYVLSDLFKKNSPGPAKFARYK